MAANDTDWDESKVVLVFTASAPAFTGLSEMSQLQEEYKQDSRQLRQWVNFFP